MWCVSYDIWKPFSPTNFLAHLYAIKFFTLPGKNYFACVDNWQKFVAELSQNFMAVPFNLDKKILKILTIPVMYWQGFSNHLGFVYPLCLLHIFWSLAVVIEWLNANGCIEYILHIYRYTYISQDNASKQCLHAEKDHNGPPGLHCSQ